MFLLVRFGRVASESAAGTFEFEAGATAFIASARVVPRVDVPVAVVRSFLQRAPAPEDVEVSPELLRDSTRGVKAGDLAVAVYEGRVSASSTKTPGVSVELGEGDAGLLAEDEAVRLAEGVPAFVTEDPYNISPGAVEVGEDGTVKGELPSPDEEDSMSCRM